MRVVEHAKAKINLALHILGRRMDGYHELDSIVAFAEVGDVLTLERSDKLSLTTSGPFAKDVGDESNNTVLAAWHALSAITKISPVHFYLEKNLPVASGIGGGSADAAASLRGLIKLFDLTMEPRALNNIALKLGADVPVCINSRTCRMRGVGEIILPFAAKLPEAVVLVNPLLPCSTAKVFAELGLIPGQTFGNPIENLGDINAWRNDLTPPAIKTLPEIADVLASLQLQPTIDTSRMSGSGATCFGLTESIEKAELAAANLKAKHPSWWVVATTIGPEQR
jgi:4-diphosphocytidyl-2-C-methyl-D-erythritol kinase